MKMKLELCTNTEALRGWCGLDWSGIEEGDEAADLFAGEVWNSLESAGYDVEHAKGQRNTCHGWNGANVYRWKRGPVASFEIPTAEQEAEITDIVEKCNAAAAKAWSGENHEDYEDCDE
jgi:hypothetical protein